MRKTLFVIGLTLAVFLLHSETWAATFTVNSIEDAKRAAGLSSKCDCKATNSKCTLRAAIETANLCVPTNAKDSDNIVLSAGSTYQLKLGEALNVTKGAIKIYANDSKATINIGGQNRIFYVYSGTTLKLENLNLLKGHPKDSASGGAIFNNGTLNLTKSSIKNSSSDLCGGAIYNVSGSTVTLDQSTIEANTAVNSGGAICNSGTLTIDSSTIGPNNSATNKEGGGIYNAGTAMISNSTISGNTSKSSGGGFFSSGTAALTHVTIAQNSSTGGNGSGGKGGGIFATSGSSFSLYNSIVVNNSDVYNDNCSGSFSGKGNTFDETSCSFPNDVGSNIYTSDNNILNELADNSGPTKTHALNPLSGSAIDMADIGWVIDVDQRLIDRDAAADVGAYEYVGKCGDSLAQKKGLGEQCDDGNVANADGCSSACKFEPTIQIDSGSLINNGFGKVAIGSEKSEEIVIKNAYDNESTLEIKAMVLSVGGANYSLPYAGDDFSVEIQKCDPYPVIPYAGCTISVKFHPSVKGSLQAQLTIKSNDPKNPEVAKSLTGEGYEDAVIVSPSNIIFSDAKLLETASQELVIINSGIANIGGSISNWGDFGIEDVSCSYGNFTIPPNDSCIFKITLKPEEVKSYSSTLKITTNNPKYPEFNIPVEATVTPPIISTEPVDTLDFGKVVAGGFKDLSITINNSGASKSYLYYVQPISSNFSLQVSCSEVPALGSCETQLKFLASDPSQPGTFDDFITIISKDPQNPTKVVKLTGVATTPKIQVSTTNIDYGNVIFGKPKEESLNILNIGSSDLTISKIDLSDSEILSISQACMDMPIVVKPNEACEIKITFSPAKEQFFGNINVYSNDPLKAFVVIGVHGVGVEKPLPALLINPSEISISITAAPGFYTLDNVELYNKGNAALTVTDVAISGEGFGLLPDDAAPCGNLPFILQSDAFCKYGVKFGPAPAGEYSGALIIVSDSGGVPGTKATALLKGIVKKIEPEIDVENANIDFGEIGVGSVSDDKVTIFSNNIGELTISGIDDISDKENFSLVEKESCVKTVKSASLICELGVEFHPKSAGSFEAYTYIHSNDEINGKYKITLIGKASGPGVSIDPMELSFGKRLVGDSLAWPVKITNTAGKADLKVTNMAISGTSYSLNVSGDIKYCESSTPVIQPGDHCIVAVVFTPLSAGLFDGTLDMTMEGLSDVHIKISGIGYVEEGDIPSEVVCGNGVTETGEACDDGNTVSYDGCSDLCAVEIAADDGKEDVEDVVADEEKAKDELIDGGVVVNDGNTAASAASGGGAGGGESSGGEGGGEGDGTEPAKSGSSGGCSLIR